jgi:hypothetical protein
VDTPQQTWRGKGITRFAKARDLCIGSTEGEFDQVWRELVDPAIKAIAKGEVLQGDWEISDRMVECITYGEAGELRRELVHWLVEAVANG